MKTTLIFLSLTLLIQFKLHAQDQIKDFFYVEPESKNLPLLVRGNIESKKILLYIQGGGANNSIDFARSDYPKWKNSLENHVAIAYFDQRGLNKSIDQIDTSNINSTQVLKDIFTIAKLLHQKYNAEIYLFGHSMGGVKALKCLVHYPEETSFINAAIVFNAPITTDFSPERYNYYRPLYLKNLAKEFIDSEENVTYWQEAYDWMVRIDSISSIEDSRKWNNYVDNAFTPYKRKISLGMFIKTIFYKPYNPVNYFYKKDNKYVADKLWYEEKKSWDHGKPIILWDSLPRIKHPVLLITSRYDAIAVPEEIKAAHEIIDNSQLVIIPDAGHESYLEKPETFNESVLRYIR